MNDAKNRGATRDFSSASHALSAGLTRIKSSPALLLSHASLVILGILFARCHVIFGARPLAIGLLTLLPSGVFSAMIGAIIGALSLGGSGTAYAIIYTLTVALRIIISGSLGEGQTFGENLLMRICEATISGFILAIYQLILAGFGAASLLFGLAMTLIPPIVCFALSGVFDSGMRLADFFGSDTELLSLEDRPAAERYALIFFHMSAALLSLFVSLSLAEIQLFGFSFSYVYSAVITLFVSHRYGAARGAIAGFASMIPLSASNAASFALAITTHLMSSSTVMHSPGSRNTCEPPIEAAASLTDTSSPSEIFSLSSASITRRSVIILVTDALGSFSWLFFSNNTCPVDNSISTADLPPTSGVVAVVTVSSKNDDGTVIAIKSSAVSPDSISIITVFAETDVVSNNVAHTAAMIRFPFIPSPPLFHIYIKAARDMQKTVGFGALA